MSNETPLKGWCSFWEHQPGEFFLSDSYATEKACRDAYTGSDIDSYIDLAQIPETAIKRVRK
jgi:hypothetical protein